MRVSASLGLVVLLASLASCEQRNFDRCVVNDPNFQCDPNQGKFCKAIPNDPNGLGTCVASECTATATPNGCAADKPVCTTQGRCVACSSNSQCAAVNPALPQCVPRDPNAPTSDLICAECGLTIVGGVKTSTGCTDAMKPACDATTHTCRACSQHSECPSGVCVKDDTLNSLTPATKSLFRGMCAPVDRVTTVDDSACTVTTPCPLQTFVSAASVDKPYVLVNSYLSTKGGMSGGMVQINPIAGLPEQHLISKTADLSPPQLGQLPLAVLAGYSTTTPNLLVNPGASVTVEGFLVRDGATSVYCNSDNTAGGGLPKPPVATSVKLVRSIIMSSSLAIKTRPLCQLTLDQSWIGTPPKDTANGNDAAANLDSTKFEIVNSVFDHNFNGTAFGGLTLTDSKPGNLQGRIVNSTFYRHESTDATPATAIYCPLPVTTLTVFNTLFINSSPATKPYVHTNCRTTSTYGYIGSDETTAPPGMGIVTGLADSIFTSPGTTDLTLSANTPASVISGGVLSFNGLQSPAVDIKGGARSNKASVTLGAFEVAH